MITTNGGQNTVPAADQAPPHQRQARREMNRDQAGHRLISVLASLTTTWLTLQAGAGHHSHS